jgi:hypothetical protein
MPGQLIFFSRSLLFSGLPLGQAKEIVLRQNGIYPELEKVNTSKTKLFVTLAWN